MAPKTKKGTQAAKAPKEASVKPQPKAKSSVSRKRKGGVEDDAIPVLEPEQAESMRNNGSLLVSLGSQLQKHLRELHVNQTTHT